MKKKYTSGAAGQVSLGKVPSKRKPVRPKSPGGAMQSSDMVTQKEIQDAEKLLVSGLQPKAVVHSADERFALAVISAHYRQLQSGRGSKSSSPEKRQAAYRRSHVNLLLRYVIDRRFRNDPNSARTVMEVIGWLDAIGIPASVSQVRRDIHKALASGPLS